jgi:hypothetical protein
VYELPLGLTLLGDIFESSKHESISSSRVDPNILKF